MLLSKGRVIHGLIRKVGARNAGWVNPRWKDGKAQPHELGRWFRQNAYEHGEFTIALIFCAMTPFIYWHAVTSDSHYERMVATHENYRTTFVYPYAKREEDA